MNDSNAEVITLEVDDTQVRPAVDRANAALDSYGKKAVTSINSASRAYEEHGSLLVRTNDRSRASLERLIAQVEKSAQAYGKTGVERLIAQRDQMIQRLGNEEAGVKRVTAAYDQMIAAEKRMASESAGAMEKVTTASHEARGAMALMGDEMGVRVPRHLRSFIASLPGVGAAMEVAFTPLAIIGLIEIITTAVEKVGELKDSWDPVYQAEKRAMEKSKDLLKDFVDTAQKSGEAIRKGISLSQGEGAALKYDVGNLELDVNSSDQTRIRGLQSRLAGLNARADEYTVDARGRQHLTTDARAAAVERGSVQKELENANAKLQLDQRELANKRLELQQYEADEAEKSAKERKTEEDKANAEEHRLTTERFSFLKRLNKYVEERANKARELLIAEIGYESAPNIRSRAEAVTDAGQSLAAIMPGATRPGGDFESPAAMKARMEHEGRMGAIGISNPAQLATQSANARLALIDAVYQREVAILDVNRDAEKISTLKAQRDLDATQARYQLEEKIADQQKRQFEEISQASAGLFHTLFTNPRQFGGQLTSTIREAALKPVTTALGNITASFLSPMLGGGKLNDVQLIGGAVPVHIVNIGGGGGTSVYGGGGFSGGFGGGGGTAGYDGGFSPMSGLSSVLGPGGTPGFAPGPVGTSIVSGGGFTGFGSKSSGGFLGRLFGGFGGFNLGGLKDSFWNESLNKAVGNTVAAGSLGFGGKLGGVLTSKGAAQLEIGAGSTLAMAGLMGGARGTGGGVLLDTFGGALTGAGIGTMILPGIGTAIGAGIGAAAGFAAGIGEIIAGVETPQRQAHRLIQSIYGVDMPERGGVIQQIVAMAQQYGGSISMAVRTPQARQLIELYSMSTGQGSRGIFLDTPRSASLVQNGSQLFQGLSYFDGAGYNFASSLPNLNHSSGTIPTFNPYSNGGTMSFSLDGPATTALLSGQVVRTATPGYVASQNVQALSSGGSRYSQAAALISPSTIFA